jgi:NAD(P)-dependent dehydrogenase (short-subunit alcohol dehydrogenase family)
VLERSGHIDVLINNAGYGLIGGIEQASMQQARADFDTNYFGTIELIRTVLPPMRARGAGHIVSISSMFVPTLCPPAIGHYVATKAALEAALQALAAEVAPFGIRVTNVQPGPVDTELSRDWARPADDPRPTLIDDLYAWIGSQPGIVLESPQEVAEAVAAIVDHPQPPLAAQTNPAARAWIAAALRDPSRSNELGRRA